MAGLGHALLLSLLIATLALPARAGSSDFAGRVRVLLAAQDAVAKGHGAAIAVQRSLVAAIEEDFGDGAAPQTTPRNARAAIGYVLSGGPPAIAERLAGDVAMPEVERRLIAGALRFKRGDSAGGWQQLAAIDATTLRPETAGRVALAQSMLAPDGEPERKLQLLRIAANLMPGTLVEDSALRRLSHAAAAEGRLEIFWPAVDRYFRRFPASAFLPDFAEDLVGDLNRLAERKIPIDPDRLDLVLLRLPRGPRCEFYLRLAQTSWRAGQWPLTRFAAARARRLAVDHSREWKRAELYAAAGGLTGPGGASQGQRLAALDAAALGAEDRMLLTAATRVADLIAASESPTPHRNAEGVGDTTAEPAVVARARRSLSAAQDMLEEPGETRP